MSANSSESRKFGTFGGVFTPNVLTILGVIMFLRAGWVVGNAGLWQALLILCLAKVITLLTSLSLSALATNTKVSGGGAYFLISRSLGLQIGGSIGVPLYLAQAISVAFYVIGFTESLEFLVPGLDPRWVASAVLGVLFVISWVGADLAIKAQYGILAVLGLSLLSFFTGWHPVADWSANFGPAYEKGQDFWSVFAIFFPAVTGIMAGASMSGDLKDPARSIPRGTLAAVGVTWVIYAAQMVWLSLHAPREELLTNNLVMKEIARVPVLIFAGLWAATLSSGLASLVAAPRTLQALARDGVAPGWLGRGAGRQDEPRLALLVTAAIAEGCILLGDLDLIAPIITMFFLTTYGMVNLAAGLERWVSNPSYRPTFRVHWIPSLLGALGCAWVMFILNPVAFVVATLLIGGLYGLLTRRRFRTAWGDARSGFWFALARLGLLRLSASQQHVHNWRPIFLVLTGNPKERAALVRFADWFEANRGLLFLAQVVSGDWEKMLTRQATLQKAMEEFIHENRLSAVAKVVIAEDFAQGVAILLQVSGLGALQPNTVLIGWSDDAIKRRAFVETVRRVLSLRRNLVVFAEAELPDPALEPRIDVWWRGRANGSLMLTLAHLLRGNPQWRSCSIRLLRIIQDPAGLEEARAGMNHIIESSRIEAAPVVLVDQAPAFEVIGRHSERSAVCFVGMALQALEAQENPLAYYEELVNRLKGNLFITKSWQTLE